MAFLSSFDISISALTAQRFRMDVIMDNIANAQTTKTANGGPYQRRSVSLRERDQSFADMLGKAQTTGGVEIDQIVTDQTPPKMVYDPTHPDANVDGYVALPNVDTLQEMMDMISATRAYDANVTAFNAVKAMTARALEIGR